MEPPRTIAAAFSGTHSIDKSHSLLDSIDSSAPTLGGSIDPIRSPVNNISLSMLAKSSGPVEVESNTSSLLDTESNLAQLRHRISNRPVPLPLRSISPLSSSSSAAFLSLSFGAPAVDLEQHSLSLSTSSVSVSNTQNPNDIRLSQLIESSLSFSFPPNDMSHSTPAVTTSLPISAIAEDSQTKQDVDVKGSSQMHSSPLRRLSATTTPIDSPRHTPSDDDHLLVISPTCAFFVRDFKRSTLNISIPFGCVVKARICSFCLMHWRSWCNTRKKCVATLYDSINKRVLSGAFSSIKTAYAQNIYRKMLIHWAWFKIQQQYIIKFRFRTCKALNEAFLLQRSFRGLRSKMCLIETLNTYASSLYRKTLLHRCLFGGLVPAHRELVALSAQAALHHHLVLHRVSFCNLIVKIRLLRKYEECCISRRSLYLVAVSFRSMLKMYIVFHRIRRNIYLIALRKSMDRWRYIFFKRLRMYASYDVVSTKIDKRYLLLTFSTWYKKTKISSIFYKWKKLCKARILVRKYSGTSVFDYLTINKELYTSTYKGVHPRVDTLFRGAFNYLRDRAKLLSTTEKLITSMLKRRAFESVVVAYCKREASANQTSHKNVENHKSNKQTIEGSLQDNNFTDTPSLILLNAKKYLPKNRKDNNMNSDTKYIEFGVQVFLDDSQSNQYQSTLPTSKGNTITVPTANADFSNHAESSYISADVRRLNTTLTYSPTTVRQIINKYRSQPINEQPSTSKPITRDVSVQNEECDDVYCITNIVPSPVRSPSKNYSPKQLPVLRHIHRVRPKQPLLTHFNLEKHVTTGRQNYDCAASSSSVEEISSAVYENHVALQGTSSEYPDGDFVYSEIASPFHFTREHSVSPKKTNSVEHSTLVRVPTAPSEFNNECEGILIEGPTSSPAPARASISSQDPVSDMFAEMQILSFTTGQLSESVIAPLVEHKGNAMVAMETKQLNSRLSTARHLQLTEEESYRMLDTQYNLVSSFTEAVKKYLDMSLLTHSSD